MVKKMDTPQTGSTTSLPTSSGSTEAAKTTQSRVASQAVSKKGGKK